MDGITQPMIVFKLETSSTFDHWTEHNFRKALRLKSARIYRSKLCPLRHKQLYSLSLHWEKQTLFIFNTGNSCYEHIPL